ncbi:hypothetical protein ACFL6I_29410, partial [candidate division KSB1 bacterium]
HLNYPYVLTTPFGLDYKLALYKKDTTYITINQNIGVQYLFSGSNYIMVYFEIQNSNLLNTEGFQYSTVLPPFADISSNLYGVEYQHTQLDYLYNPRKGFKILFSGAAGSKTIKKNNDINPELYDDLDLKTTQYHFTISAEFYQALFKRSTFLFRSQNAYIYNPNLFENELYRIGGLKTLRGFDEESILASYYSILTFEFRYLFERNSFFSLFWNGAYYEKELFNSFLHDLPYGFGAGISFESRAGIFSIYYALGKQFDNPVDLKSSKIHFGLTSIF